MLHMYGILWYTCTPENEHFEHKQGPLEKDKKNVYKASIFEFHLES